MAVSPNTDSRHVVIIGAGCAGLAAGVRLASRGVRVTVVEEAPRLGGRASVFTDRETGESLDNGQHALFGCYRETYEFLRVIGTAHLAPLDPALALTMADDKGRTSTLTCPGLPPPWHLVGGVLAWGAIPLRDRIAARHLAGVIRTMRREGAAAAAEAIPSHLTVAQWLQKHRQPPSLCDWLWYPLAFAALNQDPAIAAARSFVRVIGELFGATPGASSLGIPSVPLDELYAEPAAQFIEAHGGVVRRRVTGRVELNGSGGAHRVIAGDEILTPNVIISAVPWHALSRQWIGPVPEPLSALVEAAGRVESAPIVTANLWLDRDMMTDRQLGMVGTSFHWAFKKTSGVFSDEKDTRRLFESPQEVAQIASREAGYPGKDTRRLFRVSLVASGAEALVRRSNEDIAALAERELKACLPSAAGASCLRSLVVREARATFSLAPTAPLRPATETPIKGYLLAGDWTDTGLPGTIEGAVLSGHRAADAAMIVL